MAGLVVLAGLVLWFGFWLGAIFAWWFDDKGHGLVRAPDIVQYAVAIFGLTLSSFATWQAARWWLGRHRAVLVPGEMTGVDHRGSGDSMFYYTTVRVELDNGPKSFEDGHGSCERRYDLGQLVFVRVDRGKPEIWDELFAAERYAGVFIVGLLLIASALLHR